MKWREFIAVVNRGCGVSEKVIAQSLLTTDIEAPGFLDQEVVWNPEFDPEESMKVIIERTRKLKREMELDPVLKNNVLNLVNRAMEDHAGKN